MQVQLTQIKNPHANDVLFGRGNCVNAHPGNKRFRSYVQTQRDLYNVTPKRQKPFFAKMIVSAIRRLVPLGRFLKQDPTTQLWSDVGERKAWNKTRQALREKPILYCEMTHHASCHPAIRLDFMEPMPLPDHNQQLYLLASRRVKEGAAKANMDTMRSLTAHGHMLNNGRYINANGVWVEKNQALRELAPELRHRSHCYFRQQQKHLNTICADKKTDSAPDNIEVMETNMVHQQEVTCNNVHITPGANHESREKATQVLRELTPKRRHRLHISQQQPPLNIICSDKKTTYVPNNNEVVGPDMLHQQEVNCDNVHIPSDVSNEAREKASQALQEIASGLWQRSHVRQQQPHLCKVRSDRRTNSTPDNTKVVGPNMVHQRESTCDNVNISSGVNHEPREKNQVGPNIVCQREVTRGNVHVSSAKVSQVLQELAPEVRQRSHARQQQKYLNIICSDKKTDSAPDNTKVVGSNIRHHQEVTCDNVHISSDINHEAREKASQALRELASGLWQRSHISQQQPHLNIICSDKKTNSAPDNSKVVGSNIVHQQEVTCDNVHISSGVNHEARAKSSQTLQEVASGLWQRSHVNQQQPHLNIICSGKKTSSAPDNSKVVGSNMVHRREVTYNNVHLSVGANHMNTNNSSPLHDIKKIDSALDNAVVEPILSNALVGPNMASSWELTCDNVDPSPAINSVNVKMSPFSHGVRKTNPITGNAEVRPNVVLQGEVTCDNVYSSLDGNPLNVKTSLSSNDTQTNNFARVTSEVRPTLSNTEVEPNVVLQRKVACDNVYPSPCVNSVNTNMPSPSPDIQKIKSAVNEATVRSSPSYGVQNIEHAPKCLRVDNLTIACEPCDSTSAVLSTATSIPYSVLDGIPTPSTYEDELYRIVEEQAWGRGP